MGLGVLRADLPRQDQLPGDGDHLEQAALVAVGDGVLEHRALRGVAVLRPDTEDERAHGGVVGHSDGVVGGGGVGDDRHVVVVVQDADHDLSRVLVVGHGRVLHLHGERV